ncbi:WG repeat-containing protein [Anaerocolumna sp. MB42-C2]|uniref:WG repeat-containing protein n=1 Tax=Anaerocolumna sp. MB42-C2 TaxID=3070997 RepID=UPI0027DFBC7A|nr:WG repeat-containing protein [Anaerocolumna sp. MB42-C2]WMJ85638.1 WG repeat-containing protein [Anaerocolumna sp. MB42-C2]
MKQLRNYIKKAALVGVITFAGYLSCAKITDVAYASGSCNTAMADTGRVLLAEKSTKSGKSTALYPISVQTKEEVKYGYIDGAGKTVIQPTYDSAGNFSEGLAVVYNNNKNQVINQKGEVIFETEGWISEFHNGLAAFYDTKSDGKYGYINTKGKIIIKPQYNNAGDFRADHTAVVSKGDNYYVINNKGKALKTYRIHKKEDEYYDDITGDGYIIINDSKTFLKGVISLSGKVIIKPAYGEIVYLGNDLFGVKKKVAETEGYLLNVKPAAIFNGAGKQLTPYQFYDLSKFSGGYASATDDKYTYLINKSGKKVTSLPAAEGRGTMEVLGDIIQVNMDNEFTYMKKDGTIIWKKDEITKLSSGITVNTLKSRPNKYVTVNYPKISGLGDSAVETTINKKLKSLFTDSRKNLKKSDYLFVSDSFTAEQIKDLLIINKTGYDYPVGAAHGTPLSFYYIINVKTGEFYQLKDLFQNKSDYVSKLNKIVAKQMKENTKKGMVYFADDKNLIRKDQFFFISEDSLTVYFDSGAIAPYAAGFQKFEIPFQDINSIINTDGAFWKAFH